VGDELRRQQRKKQARQKAGEKVSGGSRHGVIWLVNVTMASGLHRPGKGLYAAVQLRPWLLDYDMWPPCVVVVPTGGCDLLRGGISRACLQKALQIHP
jgi:hypothetical protein